MENPYYQPILNTNAIAVHIANTIRNLANISPNF